jgi:glycerol-3-phosphate O-acyltransferase
MTQENAFYHAKHAKNGAKTRSEALFDVFMRNSLQTFAINREILYSHPLINREILINLSQKIAKFQTNASAPDGRFQTNICGV